MAAPRLGDTVLAGKELVAGVIRAAVAAVLLLAPSALALAPSWVSSTLAGERDSAQAVAFAPDGTLVAVGIVDQGSGDARERDMRAWAFAADGAALWDRTYDLSAADRLEGVAIDPRGAVFVAGTTDRGVGDDAFVARLDASGGIAWSQVVDKGTQESVRSLALDAQGNLLLVGVSASMYGLDGFVAKLSPEGVEQWARAVNLAPVDELFAIAAWPDGTIVAAGRTLDGANVNALLRAFDADGRELWTRVIDDAPREEARGVAALPDGGLAISGTREGAHWIAAFDADGTTRWSRSEGSGAEGRGLALGQGALYAAGIEAREGSGRDAVVRKLALDGTLLDTIVRDAGPTDGFGAVAHDGVARIAASGASEREDGALAAVVAVYPDAPVPLPSPGEPLAPAASLEESSAAPAPGIPTFIVAFAAALVVVMAGVGYAAHRKRRVEPITEEELFGP